MTAPKMKPCAKCKTANYLAIYIYEHGGRRVECEKCNYMSHAYTSKIGAVRAHNAEMERRAAPQEPKP